MYELHPEQFVTPRNRVVTMLVRADTNDHNTLYSCLDQDEYGLRDLHLTGWALDIGAYSGGVTVALLADNPDLQVVAVEPVPGNVELLRRNLEANGLTDRCVVIEGAAGDGSEVNIRYGYSGSELATHHAFVGNMSLIADPAPDNPHEVRTLRSFSIKTLRDGFRSTAKTHDDPHFDVDFAFVKIDCEGCEWDVDLSTIPLIRGEWHPTRGHTQADVLTLLPGHDVTFTGPVDGPGGFEAVLRA